MRRLIVGGTLFMLACGVPLPWDMKGAPKPPPDIQYRTGTEVGADVYIWNCFQGERVVIMQNSSAMCGASAPKMQRGPCGEKFPFETTQYSATHHDVPDGLRWPGSPPPKPEELDLGGVDAGHD